MVRVQALSRIHAFPRPEQHLTQQTISGGIVSLLGAATVITLFTHELLHFLSPSVSHKMSVDETSRGVKLPIHFDITFPALPCQVLSLSALDMSGKEEIDIDNADVHKMRLDSRGFALSTQRLSSLKERKGGQVAGGKDAALARPKDAEEDARAAFMHLFHQLDVHTLEPQIREMQDALAAKEGCRLTGKLLADRVSGHLHMSIHMQSFYVVQKVFPNADRINMSHMVHSLSFGRPYPGMVNPLDGFVRIIHPPEEPLDAKDSSPHQIGTFKYYLKLVPTEYRYLSGRSISTNQFSVSEYFLPLDPHTPSAPALIFNYDLSAIAVTITEERRNFFHFLTRLCAVVGGTLALTGMMDRAVYALLHNWGAGPRTKGHMQKQ